MFIVTAILLLPTILALRHIAPGEINPQRAHGGPTEPNRPRWRYRDLFRQRSLLLLACCVGLFHLANAAMLPLMGSVLTSRLPDWATVLIATCIVVPQLVVALIAPWVGRQAHLRGRRPLLLLGFTALAIRGLLFATFTNPAIVVAAQLLDGVSAAVLGVMVPLIVADITRGTGRFNSSLGVVGMVAGGGAALSTTLAGTLTDTLGSQSAFFGLGIIALMAVAAVTALMTEVATRTFSLIGGRQGGSAIHHELEVRLLPLDQAAIDREIFLRHAPRREVFLKMRADFLPRQFM